MDLSVIEDLEGTPITADGTLVIMVCRAKHLPNRRKLDKQTPYVTLRLGTTAKKTPGHFRAGQTPDWTHEVRFQLTRDRRPYILLNVLDETKGDPTPIGACEIDGSIIFQPENQTDGKYIYDKWFDLKLNGRRAGMIYLEMTFYPSAPVLPPKLYEASASSSSSNSNKNLPPPPPEHPLKYAKPSAMDDIFVSSDDDKRRSFFKSPLTSSSSNDRNDDIFVASNPEEGEEPSGLSPGKLKQKYFDKFNKFRTKFQTKEPVNHLWNSGEREKHTRANHISPIDATEYDNLEELERNLQINHADESPSFNPQRLSFSFEEEPPSPPAHSDYTPNPFPALVTHTSPARAYSPPAHKQVDSPEFLPSPPPKPSSNNKGPLRKPPPGKLESAMKNLSLNDKTNTTSIPFSADSIGLEEDQLPTKVYCMDKPIKSLSHSSLPNEPDPINVNEIDPRYYAPTPDEHFKKNRQKARDTDYRSNETGYLGNGQWETFSPSIFDKLTKPTSEPKSFDSHKVDNDENLGFENKPHVPPKIPQGLTEQEYYVLEKEKYLRDINGRRM